MRVRVNNPWGYIYRHSDGRMLFHHMPLFGRKDARLARKAARKAKAKVVNINKVFNA